MYSSLHGRCVALFLLVMLAVPTWAAEPASGTLSPTAPELSYTSGPFLVSNPVGITANGAPDCIDPALPCDDFALSVSLPGDYDQTNPGAVIRVAVAWDALADDYDIFLYDGDSVIAQSASGANPEVMTISAGAGARELTVRIVPYTVTGSSTSTVIALEAGADGGTVTLPPAASGIAPRFAYHQSPNGVADGAGEPTVGFNPHTGRAMFIAALETDRVTFAENSGELDAAGNPLPASCDATWEDVSYALAVNTLDPILETHQDSGRTFSSQLTGANSIFAYTDDDGETWIPGQIGPPNGGVDHQTVGTGPYSPEFVGLQNPDGYAVYYCSQSVAAAFCARSDDGGLTFGPGIPIFEPALDCEGGTVGALHGHVQVSPDDGTVYVPFGGCGGNQAVSVSEDSGLTWTVHTIPQSEPGDDPGLGIASDGTAYFCYINGTGSPHVTVSHDKGATWSDDYDVGARAGIRHAVFPTATAGDGDRAACAFIGTADEGNPESLDFEGVWYPYVATTYDGGQSWHTINVSPEDPVQGAGGICLSGTTCGANRNLLDFNDIIKDDHGRVLFGFADGCVGACILDPSKNSFTDDGVIVHQQGGRSLFAAFDPIEPAAPGGACLSGERDTGAVKLSWREPDDGGSPITGYDVYRGTSAADVNTLIGSTAGKPSFEDTSADPAVEHYFYRVVAKNTSGSTVGNVLDLPIGVAPLPETSCALPGITVSEGEAGNCTVDGCTAQTDLIKVSIAELTSLPDQLVFDVQVDSLAPAPLPGNYWLVLTSTDTGENLYLSMDTATGTPAYSYGTYVAGTAGLLTFTYGGDLHEASTYTSEGHIYLVADKALFGDLQPGDAIAPIDVRTRTGADAVPSRDTLAIGDYTVRGTSACVAGNVPTALLGADKQSGTAPLSVNFTVTGGVNEPGLSLHSYTLSFGDGETSEGDFDGAGALTIGHSYADDGVYPARLSVTDSAGNTSINRAERVIEVGTAPPGEDDGDDDDSGRDKDRFGGASAPLLLLPMLVLALLRRRRR
jgi:PKD repeat protein